MTTQLLRQALEALTGASLRMKIAASKFMPESGLRIDLMLATREAEAAIAAIEAELTAPQDDLHARIMNIPCRPYDGTDAYTHYRWGHRDARHAAAELVSEHLAARPAVPQESARVLDRGFKYENGDNTPTVLVGFAPNDWAARDAFAARIAAARPAGAPAADSAIGGVAGKDGKTLPGETPMPKEQPQ